MTLWIDLPYATFGAVFEDGICVRVAPIGHWMIGKHLGEVVRWVKKRGERIQIIEIP